MQCAWITQVRGTNPNTGKEVDEWECAVKWIPMLLIENSQQQRHTSAAVESFRNEVVENSVNPLTIMKTIAAKSQPFLEVTKQ